MKKRQEEYDNYAEMANMVSSDLLTENPHHPRRLNTDKEYGPYTAVYSRNTVSKRPYTVQYEPFTRRTSL